MGSRKASDSARRGTSRATTLDMKTSDVLERLTAHKRSQGGLLAYLSAAEPLIGLKIADCGSWLRIRDWYTTGASALVNANFCKAFLLCPSCASRRAGRLSSAYSAKAEYVGECRPELVPVMITLTIRNGDDLAERLEHLKASWSRMVAAARKGKSASSRNGLVEWNKVAGSVRAIEVTKKAKGWHPHIHCFALITDWIDPAALSAEWERFTGDSLIVDVRKCQNGIRSGMNEVLKYVCKISDLTPSEALTVYHTAKGSRFTDAQGCMRGVPEPDIDTDDVDAPECTGPYRDWIWLWLRSAMRYEGSQEYASEGMVLEITKGGDTANVDITEYDSVIHSERPAQAEPPATEAHP